MISFACPACQKKLSVKPELAGKKGKCPQCRNAIVVPGATAVVHARQGRDTQTSQPEAGPASHSAFDQTLDLQASDTSHEGRSFSSPARVTPAAPAPPDPALAVTVASALGQLGVYKLLKVLGQGGMGKVYQAQHTMLEKLVALKVLAAGKLDDSAAVARFEREMKAVGRLDHPHIVRALDAGSVDGTYFLVMEYVEGRDLSDVVKTLGPLPIADACELVRQAAIGLQEAHEHGMVHRDIKPSNLMLTKSQRKRTPPVLKVLDLGLALLTEAHTPDGHGLTSTGQVMGTIDYMAPEQGGDSHQVDIRADIYSLGATLFKLLAAKAPYEGGKYDTPVKKLMALAMTPTPDIREQRPDLPEGLVQIVFGMLAKNPDERFSTPDQVAEALAPYCGGCNLQVLLKKSLGEPVTEEDLGQASGTGRATHEGSSTKMSSAGSYSAETALPAFDPLAAISNAAIESSQLGAAANWAPSKSNKDKKPAKGFRGGWSKLPPAARIAALAGGGAIALLLGIILLLPGKNGTVRIETNDPAIEVLVTENGATIRKADKEEIQLTPGDRTFTIKRGDLEFDTTNFMLKKGEVVTLKIELLPDKMQATLNGDPLGNVQRSAPPAAVVTDDIEPSPADWKSVFDGRTFAGWRGVAGDAIPPDWKVEEESIVAPGSKTTIATVDTYDSFELELDWKVAPGANGGVFYTWGGATKPSTTDGLLIASPEYQIVDNQGHPNGNRPETSAGSVFSLYAPSEDATKPAGEWNQARIVVCGAEVEHWLNGKRIVSYTLGSEDWKQRAAKQPQFANNPQYGAVGPGRIVLQSNTGQVWYRNIRLRLQAGSGRSPAESAGSNWHGWPADAPAPAIAPFDAGQAKKHQEEWAAHLGVPVEYTNSIGMKFVLIPPGEFAMGSTPEAMETILKIINNQQQWLEFSKSELPQHIVALTQPLYLGVHEVTQAEFERIMGQNPSHFAPQGAGHVAVVGLDTTNHPVEMVSWNDAAEFCAKLSVQEKRKPYYFRNGETVTTLDGNGYRLPSEAEWEFSCRGGTTTRYWIDDQDEALLLAGWTGASSGARTHPVGELKANPLGLFDVHGNVWEWVQDAWSPTFYEQFEKQPAIDPACGFSNRNSRVLRGGDWFFGGPFGHSSRRFAALPSIRFNRYGFRVALSVDAVKAASAPSLSEQWPSSLDSQARDCQASSEISCTIGRFGLAGIQSLGRGSSRKSIRVMVEVGYVTTDSGPTMTTLGRSKKRAS
ncbi:MAG: SUMF1/EgtB/PvdO family nonheme iron enzyme [Pirellulales bacterium]